MMGTKLTTFQFENEHARSTRWMATAVMDWPIMLATTFMVLSVGLTGLTGWAAFELFVRSAQPVMHATRAVLPG